MVVGDGGCEAYTAIEWGVPLISERHNIAGAETVCDVEGNMCGVAMRGADALPGLQTRSRTKGTRWNLGGLLSGRASHHVAPVRIGGRLLRNRLEKVRSCSR